MFSLMKTILALQSSRKMTDNKVPEKENPSLFVILPHSAMPTVLVTVRMRTSEIYMMAKSPIAVHFDFAYYIEIEVFYRDFVKDT
ncbi:hypothetical protein JRQ81_015377 [Phrynocephalus forsythii]|uniref:Uncharacterized protein n=1 Tax=Phrynocephalus forsythii TaxID=171643 RepID=A0A9Q0XTW1_9SAUR|nr:hypothetical protein JRQ81_015377 [Phrynocephalus forsythii]